MWQQIVGHACFFFTFLVDVGVFVIGVLCKCLAMAAIVFFILVFSLFWEINVRIPNLCL